MSGFMSIASVWLVQLSVAGLSPFSTLEVEQTPAGAFLHKPTGFYVLKLSSRSAVAESCSYKMTDEGIPTGTDCKPGDSTAVTSSVSIVLDPKTKVFKPLPYGGDLLFEQGPYRPLGYDEVHALSKLTEADVASWSLTPLSRRAPCPVEASGGGLVYRGASSRDSLAREWPLGPLATDCFEADEGWFVVTYETGRVQTNGSSDGDATWVSGSSYTMVDASAYDYAWQNTLGLRALKVDDRKAARARFEASLKAKPDYPHANFNLACTLSLEKEPLAAGKRYLETVLGDRKLKATYLKKIATDADLANFRADPEYAAWLARWKK